MARTATVMVWVPALPPIEATIGISTASATICWIVASNKAITQEARMAVARLTSSQPKRLRVSSRHCVMLLMADAAEMQDLLGRLLLDDVDDVIDRQHADQAPVLVDHGGREQIVLLEAEGDVLLVVVDLEHRLLLIHDARRCGRGPGALSSG